MDLRTALIDIGKVACGEEQVADDDTEGMAWIYHKVLSTLGVTALDDDDPEIFADGDIEPVELPVIELLKNKVEVNLGVNEDDGVSAAERKVVDAAVKWNFIGDKVHGPIKNWHFAQDDLIRAIDALLATRKGTG